MATASTYTLLQRVSLNTAAASVTFSNIPQTGYTDLKIVASTRVTSGNTLGLLPIRFNGSSSSLSSIVIYGFGNNQGTSAYSGVAYAIWGYTNGTTSTSNVFANTEFTIPNYTSSNYKCVSVDSVNENNATDGRQSLTTGLWSNTAAITSVTFDALDGGAGAQTFNAGSTFSLYAISALGTTPGVPKAVGGDIVTTDGTYWYHQFLSSGILTPYSAISCDYLVIAGGGGGGGGVGGGGGAGGFRTGSSLSLAANNPYAVVVGAGGVGGNNANPGTQGFNGSDSVLSSITSTGGGGGGRHSTVAGYTNGSNGGSGGGGAGYPGNDGSGGTGIAGQGNNGGGGGWFSGNWSAGGGGGAGAAGQQSSANTGGNGGAGQSSSLSGTSKTYAGGGGGAGQSNGGSGGSGGGGAGRPSTPGVESGVMNSGSGGGGRDGGVGGSGGSGIVIIRYAV